MKQQSIKRKKEHISSVNTNKYEKQQKNEWSEKHHSK